GRSDPQYPGGAGGDRALPPAGGCVRHGADGGDGCRWRSSPPPVPALDERGGDEGPARPELLLLSKSTARRRADPGQSALLPLRAPAALPAGAGDAGRGAAVAADLRAPAVGCG